MQILVVDDECVVREMLAELLCQMRHKVLQAENGKEGLEIARSSPLDAVICDLKMPVMDGHEFLSEINLIPDPPSVIMLTAYTDVESSVKAMLLGAFDYMLKPVRADELEVKLSRLARARELEAMMESQHRQVMISSKLAALVTLALGVCHEINNPVNYIHGNAELLVQMMSDLRAARDAGDAARLKDALEQLLSKAPEMLAATERGTDRIREITLGLMKFAESREAAPLEDGCINACVADALIFFDPPTDKRTQLVSHTDPGVALVMMNRRDITQAIICLLTNAFIAVNDTDAPTVRVTTANTGDGGVSFTVEDSGPGIPVKTRDRIFDPFFTTRKVGEGAGLGLSVAYSIVVDEHHGMISVGESDLDGACFCLTLPRNQ